MCRWIVHFKQLEALAISAYIISPATENHDLGLLKLSGFKKGPMSLRITRITRSEATPEVAEIYDDFMKTRGNIPNMFRTVAHRPEIMRTMVAHFNAVMQTGTVPAKLKELVIVRTTQINRCEY